VWYRNNEQLTNATTIHYTNNNSVVSTLAAKTSGLFTCVCILEGIQVTNTSVSIEMQPQPVHGLLATPKFISDHYGFFYVMVSWLRQSSEYQYSLFYKVDLSGCFSMPCVDDFIDVSCNDTECTVFMDTDGHILSDISFYIVTRYRGCETRSKVWNYNLTVSSCGVLPPKTLFYIPFPPTKLAIDTSYRRVTMKWRDILTWDAPSVLLTYHCPKSSANRTTKLILKPPEIRTIRLSSEEISGYAPYEKCTFCLSIQDYQCGQFSEPLCLTTRLNEETPSEAPAITCANATCPTSYDNHLRNLTVTWKLPALKNWGGILREIRLRYWVISSNSTFKERVVRNVTRNRATVEQLDATLDYTIRLQACNKEGCSSYSNSLQVYGIRGRQRLSRKINSASGSFTTEWYFIVFYVAIGITLLAVVVCIIKGKLRPSPEPSDDRQESLSQPSTHEYSDVSDNQNYDELSEASGSSAV
jgi:hypothetical protein